MRLAPLILLATTASACAQSLDCPLMPSYAEIVSRTVTSLDGYKTLERDFIGINGRHWKPLRLPPSIHIPATAENFTAKTGDLKNVAQARVDNLHAAGCR
jgi:hypothetical protein